MSELQEFYNRVSIARESCAGSKIQELNVVRFNVRGCIYYGTAHSINRDYMMKLVEALDLLNKAKTYDDRLKPDEILCGILNDILHKQEEAKKGGGTQ